MKVTTLRPGTVYSSNQRWYFTILINGHSTKIGSASSAPAAKQAMREQLAILRKRHGLENQK